MPLAPNSTKLKTSIKQSKKKKMHFFAKGKSINEPPLEFSPKRLFPDESQNEVKIGPQIIVQGSSDEISLTRDESPIGIVADFEARSSEESLKEIPSDTFLKVSASAHSLGCGTSNATDSTPKLNSGSSLKTSKIKKFEYTVKLFMK